MLAMSIVIQIAALLINLGTLSRWRKTLWRAGDYIPTRKWLLRQVYNEWMMVFMILVMLSMTFVASRRADHLCHVSFSVVRALLAACMAAHSQYHRWAFEQMDK